MRIDQNAFLQQCKDSGYFKVDKQGRVWTKRVKGQSRPYKDGTWKTGPWRRAETRIGVYSGFKFYIGIYTHVFVYFWFKGPIPVGMEVDHKDQNKENPHPKNLELVTRSQNQQRMFDDPILGKRAKAKISAHSKGRKLSKEARIRMRKSSRIRWDNTSDLIKRNCGRVMLAGQRKKNQGYTHKTAQMLKRKGLL